MARGRNRIYFALASLVSSIPSIAAVYALKANLKFLATLLFTLSIISFGLSIVFFLGYKTVKHGTPMLFSFLTNTSRFLTPFTHYLSRTTIIGPIFALVIRFNFFLGFIVLLMSDQLVRAVLGLFVGRHATKRTYCKYF
jgi:hypothetical protein